MAHSSGFRRSSAITRRTAIGAAAAGCLSLSAAGRGRPSSDAVIDAHVHVWSPDVDAWPIVAPYKPSDMQPAGFTPHDLMAHAAPCGVNRVVLIQMSYYGSDNRYMLDVIRREPHRYRGVAIVDESAAPDRAMRRLAEAGVTGFRIQPHGRTPETWLTGSDIRRMWSTGGDEQLAMCHLIDPQYLPSVDAMCRRYPQTPVVIDHFARIGIDGQIRTTDLDNLCRLSEHPQVTVKVSAFYALGRKQPPYHDLAPMIRRVRDCFGAERLMWASDCPFQVDGVHTYAASVDLIRGGLDFLNSEEQQQILSGTAERVFFRD